MDIQSLIASALPFPDLYATGFADVEGLLSEPYQEYQYALVFARKLDDVIIDAIKQGPNRTYLDHYRTINAELSQVINSVSASFDRANIKNQPIKPTWQDSELDASYFENLRTPFSHKMAATRAGLGWIGKTALLVTEKFGPRVRLATILVQEKLFETGVFIESCKCGDCTICVTKCPAQAANGREWNIQTDRDLFYDAFKCRDTARELSLKHMNEKVSLCGICAAVCPKGKKAPGTKWR